MTHRHPLEDELNASAWDILSAVRSGFRALVDVKGKLAEYFLDQRLAQAKEQGVIDDYEWLDVDGEPDFVVVCRGSRLRMECKNVRSKQVYKKPTPAWKVELQRTRNSKDGTLTRAYAADEFDFLAVCLFNQTKAWDYLFIRTADLERRPSEPSLLTIMQRVPFEPTGAWMRDLQGVLAE